MRHLLTEKSFSISQHLKYFFLPLEQGLEEESEAAVDYKDWLVNTILDVSTSEGKGYC